MNRGSDRDASTPVIGITAYEEDARWGPWAERAVLVPATYVRAVERAGGAPMVLPAQSSSLASLLDRVDGLVISGGPDVGPKRYGAEPHERSDDPRSERDEFEIGMAEMASDRDTPTLAICRGLQVLNVARGGALHQHLPDVVGHAGHWPGEGEYAWHRVDLEAGSLIAGLVKVPTLKIASHHHQAIDRLGSGLTVVGKAEDGTIEAVEDKSLRYCVGVQWHPEVGDDLSLFEGLVDAARQTIERQIIKRSM
jgi:putative glutamine amidotransferase